MPEHIEQLREELAEANRRLREAERDAIVVPPWAAYLIARIPGATWDEARGWKAVRLSSYNLLWWHALVDLLPHLDALVELRNAIARGEVPR